MTGERRGDDLVLDWVRSGPELASAEFVERTLRPIPRMRQRRSWRIALGNAGPLPAIAGLAAVVVVAVAGASLLGSFRGAGGGVEPTPSASSRPYLRPSFELVIGEGATAERFVSDPAASVANCADDDDGSWSVL